MVTLGHSTVTTYAEFTRTLMERFDRRDPKQHFVELTRLKQTGSPKTYIADFLRPEGLCDGARPIHGTEGLYVCLGVSRATSGFSPIH